MAVQLLEQRRPVWGTYTTAFDEGGAPGVTAAEAVAGAAMTAAPIKAPLLTMIGGDLTQISQRYAVVSPATGKFFGIAGEAYDFLLPGELAAILDATLTTRFPVIAAGETPDQAGVVFVLDMGVRDVAREEVHQYLMIAESYTPGVSLKQAFTPLRIRCMNTLMTAMAKASALLSTNHGKGFRANVLGSAGAIASAHVEADETMALFDLMAARQIPPKALDALLASAYPHRDPGSLTALETVLGDATDQFANGKLTRRRQADAYWNGRADVLRDLARDRFEVAEFEPGVRGSLWAAYNAVVEVQDFAQFDAQSRATDEVAAMLGERVRPKVRALEFAAGLLAG